jgi:hypothetical protein
MGDEDRSDKVTVVEARDRPASLILMSSVGFAVLVEVVLSIDARRSISLI